MLTPARHAEKNYGNLDSDANPAELVKWEISHYEWKMGKEHLADGMYPSLDIIWGYCSGCSPCESTQEKTSGCDRQHGRGGRRTHGCAGFYRRASQDAW